MAVRGIREHTHKVDFEATVFGTKAIRSANSYAGYEPLVQEIARFAKTRVPPVAAEETVEIFAFMEAAEESKRREGAAVTLDSVLAKDRSKNWSSYHHRQSSTAALVIAQRQAFAGY